MVDIEKLRAVGKASAEAMLWAKELVKPGARLLDVADAAERYLRDKGFTPAFPINLSVNAQAAHYTPTLGDEKTFTDKDLVKVDFGASKDGILGDGAITVDLSGKHTALVNCVNEALDVALLVARAGTPVNQIGKSIASVIEAAGYVPVKNLGGHGVDEHNLHAEPFIPNFDNEDETELEEGDVVAIEPFATTGKGMVTDSDIHEIYSFVESTAVRSPGARNILREIESKYQTEPFAVRWLSNIDSSRFGLYSAISELVRYGAIEPHPTLVEVSGAPVAQAEAQLLVGKDSSEVITRAVA